MTAWRVEAEAVGQFQPALDAAVAWTAAVVVLDALAPFATQIGIVHAGQDGGVLDRDHRLVIVAVQCPGLHFAARAFPAMQPAVERVQVVVALGADRAQGRLKRRRIQQPVFRRGAHRTISIPSYATSHPARSTAPRSGEPSMRTGFVLFR